MDTGSDRLAAPVAVPVRALRSGRPSTEQARFLPNPKQKDDSVEGQFARLSALMDEDTAVPADEDDAAADGENEDQPLMGASSDKQPAPASTGPISLCTEMAVLGRLAGPMSATMVLQQLGQQVTIMFVGQLGAVELGAVVLAQMWANVSGMSIISGGMTGLDTLAAQAFGSKQYHLCGVLLQRAIVISVMLCVPIFFLWWFATGPVLVMLSAAPATVDLAVLYIRLYLGYFFPSIAYRCVTSYLRVQGIIHPATIASGICAVSQIPISWWLITNFGFIGAPIGE